MPRQAGADWRSAFLMALMQACFMATTMSFLVFSTLMGRDFAPDPAYSTIPVAAYVLGAVVFVVPMSLFMGRRGRRPGFAIGSCAGMAAGGLCVLSWWLSSFAAVIAAGFCVGIVTAATGYLRFAALEVTPEQQHGRVTSLVLSGGIVAAAFGPGAATTASALAGAHVYPALGAVLAAINIATLALGLLVRFAPPSRSPHRGARLADAARLLRDPPFLRAAVASVTGYSVMLLIMHATPLQMTDRMDRSMSDMVEVMRSHFLAMFVPYMFSGMLMDRYGSPRMIYAGFAMLFGCVACMTLFSSLAGYYAALILLGVGWNFMYLGGTKLVFAAARPGEGPLVQSANEFAVAAFNLGASVLSGWALYRIGWDGIQAVSLAVTCLALAAFFLLGRAAAPRLQAAQQQGG